MEKYSLSAMRSYCDEVTGSGKSLSIHWQGGGDDGWYSLLIDEKEIVALTGLQQQLLNYIADRLGYYSFDGGFSTDGTIIYDTEERAFIGTDDYSETEQDCCDCEILLTVPAAIYFDKLVLQFSSDTYGEYSAALNVVINNGPYPKMFDELRTDTEEKLLNAFDLIISNLDDFAGAWQEYEMVRSDFQVVGDHLRHTIDSMVYSKDIGESKSVFIAVDDDTI